MAELILSSESANSSWGLPRESAHSLLCLSVATGTSLSTETSAEAIGHSVAVNSTDTSSLSVSDVVVEVIEDVVVLTENI